MAEGLGERVSQARRGKAAAGGAGKGGEAFAAAAAATEPPPADPPANVRAALARQFEGELRRLRPDYEVALPKGMDVDQFMRDTLTEVRRHHREFITEDCDLNTVLAAAMTAAQLGLRLGVLGQAYVLPFWNSRRGVREGVFVAGYKGLAKLAHQSRLIRGLMSRTVYEHDEFDLAWHEDRDALTHRPAPTRDRGKPVKYYARALLLNGGYQLTDPTWHEDMVEFRDEHVKIKSGPWYEDLGTPGCGFEWMAWKTEVKKLSKLLPLDTRFGYAIEADEGVRHDLNPKAQPDHVTEHTGGRTIPGEYTERPPAADPGDPWDGTDAQPRTTTHRPPSGGKR
jgi:recombination protein RecT